MNLDLLILAKNLPSMSGTSNRKADYNHRNHKSDKSSGNRWSSSDLQSCKRLQISENGLPASVAKLHAIDKP